MAGDAAPERRHNPLVRYFRVLTLGIVGTGLMAVPVLAGSASFAVSEVFGPRQGRRFYLVLAGAIVAGMGLDVFQFNPIRMLFYSAVLNGVLAPPLLVLVMLVGNNRAIMREHVNPPWLNLLGWAATAVMTVAAAAFFVTAFAAR